MLVHLAAHPAETEEHRKQLTAMIAKWSRPILEINTDYRQLEEVERERMHDMVQRKRQMARLAAEREADGGGKSRLPMRAAFDYAIRPQSEVCRIFFLAVFSSSHVTICCVSFVNVRSSFV